MLDKNEKELIAHVLEMYLEGFNLKYADDKERHEKIKPIVKNIQKKLKSM